MYLRPEELALDARQALSVRKPNQSDLAAYFTVSIPGTRPANRD